MKQFTLYLLTILLAPGICFGIPENPDVGPTAARVCASFTPSTGAYAAGDAVLGATITEPLAFTGLFRSGINSGIISTVTVANTEVDAIGYNLWVFESDPSASTTTDNAALSVADADSPKVLATIAVAQCSSGTASEVCQATGVNIEVKATSETLYAVLTTVGAPTWAASQTVTVCIVSAKN